MDDVSEEDRKEFEEFQKENAANEQPPEQEAEQVAPEETKTEEPSPFKFKIKGEEREFTEEQIRHTLSREETFQKKYDKLERSEEYKFGVLMAAAKGGDKGAQKALLDKVVEFTGSENGDAMLSEMEKVEEKFDEEKQLADRQAAESFEEAFEDVKDDVDHKEILGTIQTDLKSRMPEKVFEQYWEDPNARRTMYDLQKSGRADELFSAFEDQLQELSLIERAKIKTDSDLYGALFVEVIKSQNAKQGEVKKESSAPELSAVSSGNRSRSAGTQTTTLDWGNMTDEEFKKAEAKMLKQAGLESFL
jgi:hypothetical protein